MFSTLFFSSQQAQLLSNTSFHEELTRMNEWRTSELNKSSGSFVQDATTIAATGCQHA